MKEQITKKTNDLIDFWSSKWMDEWNVNLVDDTQTDESP